MNPKLCIGFVLDDRLDKPDGVQQYVTKLGSWLTSQGHDVHYLVGESPGLTDDKVHHLSKTMKVRFNKNRMEMPLPASRRNIKRVLREYEFDVLHVMMPYSPLLAARVINNAPAKTVIIGTFHIAPYAKLERMATKALSLLVGRSKRKFDKVLSVSKAAQDFAEAAFKIKSDISPNVVELSNFRSGKRLARYRDRKNIIFLGRLVPRKGAKQALKAFSLLCESVEFAKNNRLIICGDGPLRAELETMAASIRQKNENAEIVFTGFLEESEKPDYLATADVAVFPATGGESFGIVLIEAMAAGSGVVLGGDNPGYSTVFSDLPEVLFDPNDTESFASLISQAAGDKEFIKRIHAQQQELVKKFDVEKVGEDLVKQYNSAIAAKLKSVHNRKR